MKYFIFGSFFVLLYVLIDTPAIQAQLKFDSVVIDTRNIPVHVEWSRHNVIGNPRGDASGSYDKAINDHIVMMNPTVINLGPDSLQLTSIGNWNSLPNQLGDNTSQTLVIVFDSNYRKIVSIFYNEISDPLIRYKLSFVSTAFFFDGAVNTLFFQGLEVLDRGLTRTYSTYLPISPNIESEYQVFNGKYFDNTTVSVKLFGNQPLIVSQKNTQRTLLYPNPASSSVFVQLPTQRYRDITLFDLLGSRILAYHPSEDEKDILLNLTPFPAGVYFLRIGNEMQKLTISK